MKKLFIIFIILFFTKTPVNAGEYIDNDIIGGCNSNTLNTTNNYSKLFPIFTRKTITCQNGSFLPANAEVCAQCPNGYTCSGGTFKFNEHIVQGINIPTYISHGASNLCSINMLNPSNNNTTKLIPIFRPKTVTLNFDDDNGNTATTTCTYDGLINLPEQPTRVGYDFKGWKIQRNNIQN